MRPTSATGTTRFVMKVSPLPTLSAAASKNKKRKKTPAERNADALYAEYLVYQSCLRDHARAPSLPDGAYGEDKVRIGTRVGVELCMVASILTLWLWLLR